MPRPFFSFNQTLGEGPYATVIRGFSGYDPTGDTWFVSSVSGSDGNGGNSVSSAFATLAQALSVAAAGDTIVLMPSHAETYTAVKTISTAGLTIVGIGVGTRKPTFTINAAADCFSLAAASITVENVHIAAPETDAATAMFNVAAAGCTLRGITGIGSKTAKNFVDCFTIAAGADDLLIEDCEIYNSVVPVNSFVNIEAAVARLRIFNSFFFGDCVTAGIIDAAVVATQLHFKGVVVATIGTTIPAVILDGNPTGLIEDCKFAGTHTTLATNAQFGNLLRLFNNLVSEETDASKQGAVIPAVDAD